MREILYLTVDARHPAWATVTDERTGRHRRAHWHEHANAGQSIAAAVYRLLKTDQTAEENNDRG